MATLRDLVPISMDALAAVSFTSTTAGYLTNDPALVPGTATANKVLILGSTRNVDYLNIANLVLNGTAITATATQINYLTGAAPGVSAANTVVVLDGNGDLDLDTGDLRAYSIIATTSISSATLTVTGLATLGSLKFSGTSQIVSGIQTTVSATNNQIPTGAAVYNYIQPTTYFWAGRTYVLGSVAFDGTINRIEIDFWDLQTESTIYTELILLQFRGSATEQYRPWIGSYTKHGYSQNFITGTIYPHSTGGGTSWRGFILSNTGFGENHSGKIVLTTGSSSSAIWSAQYMGATSDGNNLLFGQGYLDNVPAGTRSLRIVAVNTQTAAGNVINFIQGAASVRLYKY